MGNHILLFVFENLEDVHRVLLSEPWTFDKHLVVVQKYEKNTPLQDVSFNKTSMWMQVFDIPVRYMTKEVAEDICSAAGEVCLSESHPTEVGGSFVRVRVRVDTTQPLCRGRVVDLEEGGRVWVSFKYERLPIICYWCGHLDHDERDCPVWIESRGTLKHQDKQFGPFMRASLNVNPRKTVLHVSGFYENRGSHQNSHEKQKESTGSHSEMETSPENTLPPLSGEEAGMDTSSVAVNAINAEVSLIVSRQRIDVEMTTDTLDKAVSSSPPAGFHHPNGRDVSTVEGRSSMGDAEPPPKISNQVLDPKITGTYAEGDPFLAKLQEIDRDLKKFECVPCGERECAGNKQSAQTLQTVGSHNGELGLLGSIIGEQKKSGEIGKCKVSKGPAGEEKIGPGDQN